MRELLASTKGYSAKLRNSPRANPALLRYVLVSLGQVSTDGKQLSIAIKRLPKYILTILGIGFIQQPLTY
jgi:hypothetical protein